ncbi:hypothetical protein V8E53_009908 [Lactarius tabidus]
MDFVWVQDSGNTLWSGGSQLTLEETQIVENKCIHLQKLIDTFEHQADVFLHHRPVYDFPISTLDDYAEYDNSDDTDDSGVPGPNPQISDAYGSEGPNAEHIPLLLPSALGLDWCAKYGVRGARTQQTKTRAWTAVQNADNTVHQHAQNYSMARDAYLNLQDTSGPFPELPQLLATDLHVNTAVLGAAETGQQNTQLSWLWGFGISDKDNGTWMDEFNRVHWLRFKAQVERWQEEEDSIRNEALWIPSFFHFKAEYRKRCMDIASQAKFQGHVAYASYQARTLEEMSRSSAKALIPIAASALKHS